jgi:hypothetical protein
MYFHNRNNWLFADTVNGAQARASLYSLVQTARANELEPYWPLARLRALITSAERTTRLPCRAQRAGCAPLWLRRRTFIHKVRSPQVRTPSFTAQSSHLRHQSLATGASWSLAHSPRSAPPQMRFVYLDSRLTPPCFLPAVGCPPAVALRLPCCGQLGGGLAPQGSIAPMPGAPKRSPARGGALNQKLTCPKGI